jgi:hypothetical protein
MAVFLRAPSWPAGWLAGQMGRCPADLKDLRRIRFSIVDRFNAHTSLKINMSKKLAYKFMLFSPLPG